MSSVSTRVSDRSLPAPGEIIDRYRLVSALGGGSMGAIFLAEALRPDQGPAGAAVVVKILLPRWSKDAQICARFFNEAGAARLVDHPDVVRVFSSGRTQAGLPYLVMEHIAGRPLSSLLPQMHHDPGRCVRLLQQVAATMAAVHQVGIVHRDLKPGNIMVLGDADGERVKIIDFGLARLRPEHYAAGHTVVQTGQGQLMGTPRFMSPEQCGGAQDVDDRADVYSLGAIAYLLLCGRPLFPDRPLSLMLQSHLFVTPTPLAKAGPRLSRELCRLVDSMVEKLPQRRPAMAAVAEALGRFACDERAILRGGLLRRLLGIFGAK